MDEYHYHHHHQHQHMFHCNSNNPKPTCQIYCRAEHNYALTIRDGNVILAPANPSDHRQHWYKEEKFKTQAKDDLGLPSLALVNKATGQAIKHSVAARQPVQLTPYDPDYAALDHSILWTEAALTDDGNYKSIRMVNDTSLNMDAFDGVVSVMGLCFISGNGMEDTTNVGSSFPIDLLIYLPALASLFS